MLTALVLSVLALAAGLGLVVVGRDRPLLRHCIDGFIAGVIPTLIVVHVLPHLWSHVGVMALGPLAIGYGTFWLMEQTVERQRMRARVVVGVLSLHSLLDGASLAMTKRLELGPASSILIAALIMHRLPEGLVIGSLLMPRHGLRTAVAGAAVLALMTLAGAAAGGGILQHTNTSWFNLAVAAGMGSLLRAVLHDHKSSEVGATPVLLSAVLGAALALAVPEL